MAKQKNRNSALLKHVGMAIKDRRTSLSMSQEKLAELAELHTTTISDIERGKNNMTLITLELIARALQCEESSFFPLHITKDKKACELLMLIVGLMGSLDVDDKRKFSEVVRGAVNAFSK